LILQKSIAGLLTDRRLLEYQLATDKFHKSLQPTGHDEGFGTFPVKVLAGALDYFLPSPQVTLLLFRIVTYHVAALADAYLLDPQVVPYLMVPARPP
jgi:hypothetical protein